MYAGITRVNKAMFLKVGLTEGELKAFTGKSKEAYHTISVGLEGTAREGFTIRPDPNGRKLMKVQSPANIVAYALFRASRARTIEESIRLRRLKGGNVSSGRWNVPALGEEFLPRWTSGTVDDSLTEEAATAPETPDIGKEPGSHIPAGGYTHQQLVDHLHDLVGQVNHVMQRLDSQEGKGLPGITERVSLTLDEESNQVSYNLIRTPIGFKVITNGQ